MNICVIFVLKISIHSVYPLIYAGVSFPLTAKTGFAEDDTCTLGILGGYIIKIVNVTPKFVSVYIVSDFRCWDSRICNQSKRSHYSECAFRTSEPV
jgi:hypothetical protein